MRLEWVKQQLLQRGAAASRHSSHASAVAAKSSAYIVAEAMEPSGCSCVVVTPRGIRENASTSLAEEVASSKKKQQEQHQRPSSPHTRHRVTLPGITPGTILRTRVSVAEWIRASRQLPAREQFTVIMRDGRRVSLQRTASMVLPALPCRCAAAQTCNRCPWMALQERQRSKAAKQKVWQASLLGAVRNCWSATAALPSGSEGKGRSGLETPQASGRSSADVVSCFSFLHPLSIPVQTNRLQALQLFFRQRPSDGNAEGSFTTSAGRAQAFNPRDHDTQISTRKNRSSMELIREGSAVLTADGHPPVTGEQTTLSLETCLLETLEQKRLVPFLQRWAAQLPTSTRAQLEAVFISQPSSPTDATAPVAAATKTIMQPGNVTSSLQVVLVVRRNIDVLGMQSPLCDPGHPLDLLSKEEQQLVGVVTAAAPLLTDIEIAVCIRDDSALRDEGKTGAADVCVHILYPRINREASIEQLGLGNRERVERDKRANENTERKKSTGTSSGLVVRCWCEPLQEELRVNLSPYHVAVSVVPNTWCTRSSQLNSNKLALPWTPTFWRHPSALDMCCSVLMSILLEEMVEECSSASQNISAKPASSSPGASNDPKPVNMMISTNWSSFELNASPAEICAAAGQRVLDTGLELLVQEAIRLAALKKTETLSGSSEPRNPPLGTPQRMFLSVSEHSCKSQAPANVERLFSAPLDSPLRLCLYSCTSTMKTESLSALVAYTVQRAAACGNGTRVRSGVIDVDPLSSSYVAYAQIDLMPSGDM